MATFTDQLLLYNSGLKLTRQRIHHPFLTSTEHKWHALLSMFPVDQICHDAMPKHKKRKSLREPQAVFVENGLLWAQQNSMNSG